MDLALDEQVAMVLVAGDLYDGDWRDYNTGLYFVAQMARLRRAGIRVFLVAGNHDAANRMTRSLRLPENVTFFGSTGPETVALDELPVAVHGQSFATAAVFDDLAPALPGRSRGGLFNIGLLAHLRHRLDRARRATPPARSIRCGRNNTTTLPLEPPLAALTEPGGLLIASGLLDRDLPEFLSGYARDWLGIKATSTASG